MKKRRKRREKELTDDEIDFIFQLMKYATYFEGEAIRLIFLCKKLKIINKNRS